MRAASREKWLEMHGGTHWAIFYTDYALALQKEFFGHYLKGEDTGWTKRPPVLLNIRHADGSFSQRTAEGWPLPETRWTKLHLDPVAGRLGDTPAEGEASFDALKDHLTFLTDPMPEEVEITGPSALYITVSSTTTDADIFAVLHLIDPDGKEVHFVGAIDPKAPLGQGWLRASQRKLDPEKSEPWRPWHPHDEIRPLTPGEPVDLAIEIWPTCIVIPKGYRLGLSIRGRDYEHDTEAAVLSNMKNPMKGCGPFVHDDPRDRPIEIFGGRTTLHVGKGREACLLVPVIPRIA